MKSITLLATALFLICAPSPDSKTISQISAGFLSTENIQPLIAREPVTSNTELSMAVIEPSAEKLHNEFDQQQLIAN